MTGPTLPTQRESEAVRQGHVVVRWRFAELRFNRRVLVFVMVGLVLVAVAAVLSMTMGTLRIAIPDVFLAAIGQGTAQYEQVVQSLRMPRVLTALLVGSALAISGAIFQGLVRNELASPDIIGINTGAGAIGFTWLLVTRDVTALPVALFTGALAVALLVYMLSWKRGIDPNRLILVGMGVQATLAAVEMLMVRLFTVEDAVWADTLLIGSVATADWGDVRLLAVGHVVLLPCILLLAGPLRTLQLGDDTAASVGVNVELLRFGLIVVGCWFSALAIAVAGLVGFVALMIPHIARMIAGPVSGSVLVLTGVIGGLFVLVADTVGNNLLPISLPVSIVIGVIGAPYFLFLFWRSRVRM